MEQFSFDRHDSSFFTDKAKVARIPTSGMFSTAEKLRHYCQMMLDGGSWRGRRILSARLVDEMSRPQMHTPIPKYEAGLGYAVYTGKGAEMS